MESSDNLASTLKILTCHGQHYSVVELFLFMGCGGRVVNILWYNILTPPLQKIFKYSILLMESSDNLALDTKH